MMSDSLINMKALEEALEVDKLMETTNSLDESKDASGSNADTDPDHEASSNGSNSDTDPDPEASSKQLPQDVVFSDILTRVPVKSLLRFRSVSKYWKSSISRNSSFSKMHLSHFRTRPEAASLLVLVEERNSSLIHFLSLRDPNEGGSPIMHLLTLSVDINYAITNNINGLSCFHPVNGLDSSDDQCVYVCSPSVRELIALPSLQTSLLASYFFGVDPLTQEFKVLSFHTNYIIRNNLEAAENRFYVIDSRDRSWRQIYPVVPFDFDAITLYFLFGRGICVNGLIHWLLLTESTILTFCVRDEKFGQLSLPKELVLQNCQVGSLLLVGGCLTVAEGKPTVEGFSKNLWILKDYENQVWEKKSISVPFPFTNVRYQSLRALSSVHIDTLFLVQHSSSAKGAIEHVMYCDIEAKTWRRFQIPQLSEGDEITLVTTYAESLVSLRTDE